jgi:autotransporter-associated beta strand protein
MKNLFPRPSRPLIAFTALLAMGSLAPAAVISFDGTTAYTQDFQTMTGTALVTTQSLNVNTMTEVSTLLTGSPGVQGWFILPQCGTGSNAWTTSSAKWHGADSGSSSTGGFRQLIDLAGGRALGSQGSGSAFGFFGLVLQNTSSATIDTLSLSYDAVMNRNPTSTVNQYPLSYLVSSTAVSTSTTVGAAGTFSSTSMTATTMGFSTPAVGTGTGAPGTQAAITPMFKIGTKAGNLTGLGWGAGQFLYLAWKETDETGSDALAGVDNFSLSAPVIRNLVWNLAGSGVWDAATANWANNLTPTAYASGDGVTFNGTGGTITLSGALAPLSVNVSNASGTYVFSGATASDKITGATALTKAGAGSLQLTSDNDYSGGTTISGGTIVVDGASRLGTGTIALAGGTLQLAAGTYAVANALSVAAAGGSIDAVADRTISGAATLSGVLTKLGTGTLTLGGAISSSAGAAFNVAAGDLVLGQASGIVKVFANSTLTGNLILSGPIRFDVNGSSTISGPGSIKVVSSGALFSNSSGDLGGTISSEIILNSTGAAFTKGAWTGTTYTPSTTFATTVGGTNGGTLSVNKISGNSDVDISNNSSTGGGTMPLTLTGVSTYTGNTTINANTPTAVANLVLGINNALPTTTGIIAGTKTGMRLPVIDLNGYSQQVAYLADGALVSVSQYLTITNNGATASVLTLGGDTSPGTGFSGYLSDGAGGLSLVKTGSNTQTLSGFGAFNGGVTVNGGVLKVVAAANTTSSSALGTGGVVIGGTGQLFVATTITNDLTVNAGGRLAGNGATGAVTVNSTGVLAAATTPGLLNAATLTTNGLTTLKSGSVLEWKVNDAAGLAGIGYDTFAFGLGLDLSNLSAANKATIRVVSFANAGDAVFGNSTAFANGQARTFTLANVASITMPGSTNNITDLFAYDLTQFRFADGTQSDLASWSLAYDGSAIVLAYASAIPEPSTYGLGLGCLALAFVAVRRRRQSAPKA